jgi:hypothetical protein
MGVHSHGPEKIRLADCEIQEFEVKCTDRLLVGEFLGAILMDDRNGDADETDCGE